MTKLKITKHKDMNRKHICGSSAVGFIHLGDEALWFYKSGDTLEITKKKRKETEKKTAKNKQNKTRTAKYTLS
jgi:hypothetical protein